MENVLQVVSGSIGPVRNLKHHGSSSVDLHAIKEGGAGDVEAVTHQRRFVVFQAFVSRKIIPIIRGVNGDGGVDKPDAFNRRVGDATG